MITESPPFAAVGQLALRDGMHTRMHPNCPVRATCVLFAQTADMSSH